MELYSTALICAGTIKIYASRMNKTKTLEICEIAITTLKSYTQEEFTSFNQDEVPLLNTPLQNPSSTQKEKFTFLYTCTKEKMSKNPDVRVEHINNLLNSLTESEESDLLDDITVVMSNPGKVLFNV